MPLTELSTTISSAFSLAWWVITFERLGADETRRHDSRDRGLTELFEFHPPSFSKNWLKSTGQLEVPISV